MKRILRIVGAIPVRPGSSTGAQHMIVGNQVVIAKTLGRCRKLGHDIRVCADFGVGKNGAYFQLYSLYAGSIQPNSINDSQVARNVSLTLRGLSPSSLIALVHLACNRYSEAGG